MAEPKQTQPSLTLGDFQPDAKVSVEDFKPEGASGKFHESSVSQLAAYNTLMEETPTEEGFRLVREQMSTQEGRAAFTEARKAKVNERIASMRKDVTAMVSDPAVPDSVKEESVKALGAKPDDVKFNERDEYSKAALIADSDVNESEDAAASRMDMLDSIEHVNKQKALLQKAVNSVGADDQSIGGVVVDVAELFLPFAEWIHVADLQQELGFEAEGVGLGAKKAKLYAQFEAMPLDKKVELSEKIVQIMEENEDLVFTDGNEIIKMDMLNNMLLNNDYSKTEEWFDNITSALDVIGVGGAIRWVGRGGKGAVKTLTASPNLTRVADEARVIKTHTKVSPTSPSQNAKDVNPEQARKMHTVTSADKTGESSKAINGSSVEEAIIKAELPEPEVAAGKMPNKVKMEGPQYREPDRIRRARQRDGQTYLSTSEVGSAKTKLIAGFEDIEGMNVHKNSMVVRTTDEGKFSITARYSPRDGGFRTAARAIENASYAFRHYGLTAEDFVLYERIGADLVETTPEALTAKVVLREGFAKAKKKLPEELKTIDYAIGVKHDMHVTPQDMDIYDVLTVKRNLFDRLGWGIGKSGQGSITQHLVDAASTLHPQIASPAGVAVDRGVRLKKMYIGEVKKFSDSYNKMPKAARAKMTDYINEANEKGIRMSEVDLRTRGFSTAGIGILKAWRRANDIMYHAINADMAATLRNKGFKVLVHPDTDTTLFVKPLQRNGVTNNAPVYDPRTHSIKPATKEQLDDLYESGGGVSRLNEPVEVDGVWIDRVVHRGSPEGGYTRAIKSDETVMTYRDGYYPVMYDANFYIQKQIRVAGGEVRTKTIASAKTKLEVDRAMVRLQESEPDEVFSFVADRRANQDRANSLDENGWNLSQSSGLSAQKVRGERLKDAGVDLETAGRTNLVDPLEAISAQIESISARVSMRNYMDTTKSRWLDNYADDLDLPTNKFGEVEFPAKVGDIKGKSGTSRKTVGDAITLYNHLHALENGYINTIDDGFKALMHSLADEMSELGAGGLDKALRSGAKGSGPTGAAKGSAFKLFLAANPLRQVVVQGHQTVQLTAIAPEYMLSSALGKGLADDMYRISKASVGLAGKDTEAVSMLKELHRTGLLDAVDENNLVRAGMLQLAEHSNVAKGKAIAGKPFNLLQRAGFDKGEQLVLMTSWLAHRDMAIKAGVKLDRRGLDEVAGKARAFTLAMNKAGDMPYNQNTLNVMAQFLQVPHKALLQMFTNRSLTRAQRGKLFAFNTVMYGVPAGAMGWIYNNVEEGKLRDALEHGMEDILLNNAFSAMTGVEQQVDWGDLAPTNAYGLRDFVFNMVTTDITTLFTESPSGSLFFGGNARLTNAFKSALQWASVIDDYDDPELQVKYTDVGMAFMETMSGASNAFKAAYAYENKKKRSSIGSITDSDTTKFEATMQLFGFQTHTEVASREINESIFGKGSFTPTDVQIWYGALKRHLTRRGDTPLSTDMRNRVLAEGMRVFEGDKFKFRDELVKLIQKDAKAGDDKVIGNIMRQVGLMSNEDVRSLINKLPKTDTRDKLNLWIDNIEKAGNK